MLIAHARLTDNIIAKRAPKGMMFFIESIYCMNSDSSGSGHIYAVHGREMDTDLDNETSQEQDVIAMFPAHATTSLQDLSQQIVGINEKSKWLSFTKNTANQHLVIFLVYGKLIPASRRQLLIEWFRKR